LSAAWGADAMIKMTPAIGENMKKATIPQKSAAAECQPKYFIPKMVRISAAGGSNLMIMTRVFDIANPQRQRSSGRSRGDFI
jgi:hypothetical protein